VFGDRVKIEEVLHRVKEE